MARTRDEAQLPAISSLALLSGGSKEGSSMSKPKRVAVAFVALSVLMAIPGFASGNENAGCRKGKFVGSYVHADTFTDVWGDGSGLEHTFVLQLNLQRDGTAHQYWTGFNDLLLSGGTGSPSVGSWTCRSDGKLVVTLISAGYTPTTDAVNHPSTVPDPPPVDLLLRFHTRVTLLFSVTDENTLTQTRARSRRYPPNEDPSNPTGGTLRPVSTSVVPYTRLVASDADLLAP
jgi:hypothetical protein